MKEATEIGDHTSVYYDGSEVTLEQQRHRDPAEIIVLTAYETMGLLRFIEDQATLHEQRMQSLRLESTVVSPEWKYVAQYRSWRYVCGVATVWLEPRIYCDRGNWCATATGIGTIDWQDAFPRYFMELGRAQLELQEWLQMRMARYEDTAVNRKREAQNRVMELRDAILRLAPHIQALEGETLATVYEAIAARVAPGLDR